MGPSRRSFLQTSAASAAAVALAANAEASARSAAEAQPAVATVPVGAFQPASGQKYDFLIKGGDVLDPSQGLRGRCDIAIHNARIAAVEPEIAADAAKQVLMASGRLVPGLVDMYAHVYPLASGTG